jgi:dTDP-4-dehydrorhamnose 3,5-epimerase
MRNLINTGQMMIFEKLEITDVVLIKPDLFGDQRGYFMETFKQKDFFDAGIQLTILQQNQSGSNKGILRGLHYQIKNAQGKLVRVIRGEIFDVAVDLRKSSITFGKWQGVYLNEENKHQIWVPPGFAHGFYVTSKWAEIVYATSDIYAPHYERTLIWNDPQIGIKWPLGKYESPILSEKDKLGVRLEETELFE